MEENFRCNVLIMGKTGTGKSTLLNYICDANLAETGSGKPVTGEGFGEMLLDNVIESFFNGDKDGILERAAITKGGQLTPRFAYLQDYADGEI